MGGWTCSRVRVGSDEPRVLSPSTASRATAGLPETPARLPEPLSGAPTQLPGACGQVWLVSDPCDPPPWPALRGAFSSVRWPGHAALAPDWGWGGLRRNVFKGRRTPTLHFRPELSRGVGSVPLTARFAFSFVKKTSKSVCGWQTFWKSVRQKQGQQGPRRRGSSVLPMEAGRIKTNL